MPREVARSCVSSRLTPLPRSFVHVPQASSWDTGLAALIQAAIALPVHIVLTKLFQLSNEPQVEERWVTWGFWRSLFLGRMNWRWEDVRVAPSPSAILVARSTDPPLLLLCRACMEATSGVIHRVIGEDRSITFGSVLFLKLKASAVVSSRNISPCCSWADLFSGTKQADPRARPRADSCLVRLLYWFLSARILGASAIPHTSQARTPHPLRLPQETDGPTNPAGTFSRAGPPAGPLGRGRPPGEAARFPDEDASGVSASARYIDRARAFETKRVANAGVAYAGILAAWCGGVPARD